jgi:ankyrin repeat protein
VATALLPRRHEIVQVLIAAGADVDDRRPTDGRTPMFVAAQDPVLTGLLIEHGASIDVIDENGLTPLHIAASMGGVEVICKLISAGARTDLGDSSPLHLAARTERSSAPQTARDGRLDPLRALLDAGVPPDVRDGDGNTPLHVTFSPQVVDLLVRSGADVNAKNGQGDTALHLAARKPAEVGMSLLRNRADHGLKNSQGLAPLHLVARHADDLDLLRLFVEQGASLDVQDAEGQTPLIHAIRQRNTEVVKFLVRAGADLKADASGHVAADWAAKHGLQDVARELAKRGEAPQAVVKVTEKADKIQHVVFRVYKAAYRQEPTESSVVASTDPQMVTFSSALTGRFNIEPDLFHDTELTLRQVIDAILSATD